MNGYEKLIKTIRAEADRNKNPYEIRIGTMKTKTTCLLGALELDNDDFLINEELEGKLEAEDNVLIVQVTPSKYVIIAKVVET